MRLHRLLPTRLFCSWNFPGKNTGVRVLFPPSPENLPDPGIKLTSLTSPAMTGRLFTTWKAIGNYYIHLYRILEFGSILPDLVPKDLSKTWTHADSLPNCKEIIFIFLYLTLCEMIVRLLSSLQIKCNAKK